MRHCLPGTSYDAVTKLEASYLRPGRESLLQNSWIGSAGKVKAEGQVVEVETRLTLRHLPSPLPCHLVLLIFRLSDPHLFPYINDVGNDQCSLSSFLEPQS